MTISLQAELVGLQERLERLSSSPALDAQVLAAHIVGRPRAYVLAHPELTLTRAQQAQWQQAAQRLAAGEPLPYLLGHWEFYGLDFQVSPAVLIPRPETELLLETALHWMAEYARYRVIDVGVGSGCIAASLAVHQPLAQITGVDISAEALHVAQANCIRHAAGRVSLLQADLLPPGSQTWDLVCANLPYIPTATLAELPALRYEPRLALNGGPDGLRLIRRLLQLASRRLAPGGAALLEIETGQGAAATMAARMAFPQADVHLLADLAGRERLLVVQT